VKRVFYPSCLSGVGSSGEGQTRRVCVHTRPPRPRLLTELTCLKLVYSVCGFAGPRHDNTLFSKPKVPVRAPSGIVQTFQIPRSIDHSMRYLSFVSLIEFAKNSCGFIVQRVSNGAAFRGNVTAQVSLPVNY